MSRVDHTHTPTQGRPEAMCVRVYVYMYVCVCDCVHSPDVYCHGAPYPQAEEATNSCT